MTRDFECRWTVMMDVEFYVDSLDVPAILAALLDEFSAVTSYRTLRDTLPRRLASLLQCRCVLLYQRSGETLQFVSGSFADQPGWSSTLLAVAHINPIELQSELPEAQAWRARRAITTGSGDIECARIYAPLLYRQRAIGVLVALRDSPEPGQTGDEEAQDRTRKNWPPEEVSLLAVVANVVAMLLENTRLLERDQERIHELSLLNGITSQMNCTLHERARVQHIVVQRTREISTADLCALLVPGAVTDEVAWIPAQLRTLLLQRWQGDTHYTPLVLERMGEMQAGEYMDYLEPRIKTFFAAPLFGNSANNRARGDGSSLAWHVPRVGDEARVQVLGVIVGAYYKPWKLRREELVLLQILANQASAVLENIALMEDVVEARNEARRLLRQVLDDQRLKESILESIPSGLITIDMHGLVTTFNQAAETTLGYHPLEVMGQPLLKILALRGLESVLQSGQPRHETLLTSGRQGQEIALDVMLAPLRDDRGHQVGALATFADVTSMHHLEEEKRRLDRLASLGEMSASVAHEVRNPLASIKTSMQILLDDLEGGAVSQAGEGTYEAVSVVLKEVERLDSIVRDLLLFARPRHLHLIECNLFELSERILRSLQPQCLEHGVQVRLTGQDTPSAYVDAAQMEQVLLNLFLNALQAMPDGGILSITCQLIRVPVIQRGSEPRAGARPAYASLLALAEGQQPGEKDSVHEQRAWLEIVVSDTGTGIAQEDLERIFQPFYTTKAHGIGLGLPITRRLVEDHHGYIFVESQLGYGTTVSLRLPLSGTEVAGW
ncbi:MAG TPA: ATP-binding protein [Ktedonobacteraceae bacterium]|nr:ATP-binding protein [Ktedonobacteraceae bacterium]